VLHHFARFGKRSESSRIAPDVCHRPSGWWPSPKQNESCHASQNPPSLSLGFPWETQTAGKVMEQWDCPPTTPRLAFLLACKIECVHTVHGTQPPPFPIVTHSSLILHHPFPHMLSREALLLVLIVAYCVRVLHPPQSTQYAPVPCFLRWSRCAKAVGADGSDAVGTDAVVAEEVGSDGSDAIKTDAVSAEGVGSDGSGAERMGADGLGSNRVRVEGGSRRRGQNPVGPLLISTQH
jgi:hypothetical protein